MATELMNFHIQQAKSFNTSSFWGDLQPKSQNEILEKVTAMQKRHLQIPKSLVKIKWDDNLDMTRVLIPHLKASIKVASDLRNPPSPWNLLILHQDPNASPINRNIPWEIDFRNTPNKYLIKYLESANPMGKFESRFVGLKM